MYILWKFTLIPTGNRYKPRAILSFIRQASIPFVIYFQTFFKMSQRYGAAASVSKVFIINEHGNFCW